MVKITRNRGCFAGDQRSRIVVALAVASVVGLTILALVQLAEGNADYKLGSLASIHWNSNFLPQSSLHVEESRQRLSDRLLTVTRRGVGSELVWENLVMEGKAMIRDNKDPGIVVEVGMHRPKQCLQAAKAGLEAHCLEPSPNSFRTIQRDVSREPKDIRERIHLYQAAAGGTSGQKVQFHGGGSTGDHVGNMNVWKMEKNRDIGSIVVEVDTVRMDDVVDKTRGVFLMKIDTQGFEPIVFSGLTQSIKDHKIQHLIFEYWPRGMDFMADKTGPECIAVHILEELVTNGYRLYAMPLAAHPKAPAGFRKIFREVPLESFRENCLWYYSVEDRFLSEEYKMGYWSDVLAVAPNATIPQPETLVGKLLQLPPHE